MGGYKNIGVAMDFSNSSKFALKWAIDNLANKGDTIYIINSNQQPEDESLTAPPKSGSLLIPLSEIREPEMLKKYNVKIDIDFVEVLDVLDIVSTQKEIRVTAKFYMGDAREMLMEAIDELKLDILVLGSRGLGTLQRILMGSVSNYIAMHASCPVTIVKDSYIKK